MARFREVSGVYDDWGKKGMGTGGGGKGGEEKEQAIRQEKKKSHTAVRVGQTQSNMSAPKAMETRRSSG